ncbi:hypothetical protein A1O1_03254 [Capronia coronata CBS 617.96]|uniref:BTB domain-containing protein n=1 Tax=Capronia coronata CBS 617.96 TaxID=1182541 RepID=W9YZZ2_9EURO|nr:uncharacterized protein A1O1_03254 [Capronia coronata CBS 617.96]EXJ94856.1 hypothetical protein A1O1_03254 [Capronia coronata CBS 617.96]
MDIPYRSFAYSHPFKILVGPEKRAVHIHSGLLKQHSETLAALVGGGMTEAQELCAHLEDIEPDTFIRFMEFAYTGDYTVPNPELQCFSSDGVAGQSLPGLDNQEMEGVGVDAPNNPVSPPKETTNWDIESDFWRFPRASKRNSKNHTGLRNPWFERSNADVVTPPEAIEEPGFGIQRPRDSKWWREFKSKSQPREPRAWEPRANQRPDEDYGPVLLSHAYLYVFSDRYSIKPLQELVLQKLRLTLCKFTLFPERAGDVVELLKYTYANTMDHDEGIDKLRNLVTEYVVCQIHAIATNPDFLEYLKEEGFAAKDLMVKLVQRLDPESE